MEVDEFSSGNFDVFPKSRMEPDSVTALGSWLSGRDTKCTPKLVLSRVISICMDGIPKKSVPTHFKI